MSTDTTARPSSGRLEWVDLARGVTIILVVMYHVAVGAGHSLLPAEHSEAGARWAAANRLLQPLRMPLFFLLAGMLAHSAAKRPWSKVWRPRIADLWWPYLLWSAFFAVTAWPRYSPEDAVGYIKLQGVATLTGAGPYWFILVLPMFFVLVKVANRFPMILLAGVALMYLASGAIQQTVANTSWLPDLLAGGAYRFSYFAIWYVAGWALRRWIFAYTDRAPLIMVLLGAAGYVGFMSLFQGWEGPAALGRVWAFGAGVAGIAAVFPLLRRLAEWRPLAALGATVGRRTLPIYIIHPLFINVVVLVLPLSGLGALIWGTLATDVLLVPVVTALGTAAGVLFAMFIDRFGPHWTLAAPRARSARPRLGARE
jgi:uncharacterized membrane protein YcfT